MAERRDPARADPGPAPIDLRPNAAYEVRARIRGSSGRGGRALAILVALGLVSWLGYVGADRLGALGPAVDPSVGPAASLAADASTIPTPTRSAPPPVEVFQPLAGLETFPAILDGLEWVDPTIGTAVHPRGPDGQLSSAGWWFQLGGGDTLCACLDYGLAGKPGTLVVQRFAPDGDEVTATPYAGFGPPADEWQAMDSVLDPEGSSVIAAVAERTGPRWLLHLRRLPLYAGAPAAERTIDLGSVEGLGPMAGVDPPELAVLRLFVTPDARHLLVALREPRDVVADRGAEWLIDLTSSSFGRVREDPFGSTARDSVVCDQAAWASPTTFVNVCSPEEAREAGAPSSWAIGLQVVGESTTRLSLDPPAGTGWLIDGTNAEVYGWAPTPHEVVRIDASTGDWSTRQLDVPFPLGQTVSGPLPALGADVLWQPTQSASQPYQAPIVGSPDGRVVYGLGTVVDNVFGRPVSDGIWAIDTGTLSFVGHWDPAASYAALGLTPDGRALIGVGPPLDGVTTADDDFDYVLGLQDARDGSMVAVVRDLGTRLGGIPQLLAPGPPSR